MKVDMVADVGNSRIKWGKCTDAGVTEHVSLSYGESDWNVQANEWSLTGPRNWAISGSQPAERDRLAQVPTVRKIDLLSLNRQQARIEITYSGTSDQLKSSLADADLDLGGGDPTWQVRPSDAARPR